MFRAVTYRKAQSTVRTCMYEDMSIVLYYDGNAFVRGQGNR